ncbi:MAG: LD-carboxypeptidase [Lachnospiraceae bacterium]|nr:LD-carboxypeptidase [Lachnospiraceae bacterium]
MKYPEFLQKNARLGFIAPSFGCASLEPYHTRFQEALNYFENSGFIPVVGPNVYLEDGIGKSTTAENCGAEINEFFLTDNCDAVLSVGGGETMCEDLEFVDFEGIANAKPKWFMGYSDNTNLIYTLATICDIASIYGPNASSFGMSPLHPYLTDTVALLEGKSLTAHQYDSWEIESLASPENPTATLNCTEAFQMSAYIQGTLYETCTADFLPTNNSLYKRSDDIVSLNLSVSGRMLGGCLDILCVLCGTRFDHTKEFLEKYDADGTIFFLESCDLNPLAILRGLWQLKNAGWFRNTKAFLFGRPLHIKESIMGLDCRQAVLHVLGDMGVPIFFDLDIGHLPPQMPIICGAIGTVHAKGNSISITYSLE